MEDIKMYDSMVKTLSHGLKLHSPNSSGSVSGEINLPRSGKCACVAALISWDDDNVDAKLLLISNSGIQALMKFYKPGTIRHAFEDVDNLDTELLYGVLSSNSTGTLNRNPDSLLKNSTQDTGKITSSGSNKRLERVMEASITSSERAKDDMLVTNTGSPSKRKNQLSRPDTLMKSVSMQPIRSSSRDSKPNSESAKASKKYYEKQLSADRIRETTDKYHSRYSSGSRELDEDYEPGQSRHRDRSDWDSARQILRQEPRSERVRESLRRSRDDRDTTRQRGKDHYKTSYRDDEKDKSWRSRGKNEQQCDQDKSHSRAREKLLKEQSIEDLKSRSLLEKRGFISKTGSFSCRISPDENSNKHIRKRDREDEKSELSIKRTRASSMIDNKDLLKDGIDLHINPVLEQKLDQTLKATVLAVRPEPMEPIEEEHTLDAQASDIGYDDQGAKDYEAPDIVDEPEINDQEDLSRKFSLDVLDKETRNWLQSRQNAMYFEEEYGVRVYINADNSTGDGDSKSDAQTGLVSVRASVVPSDSHDISEDKWFLEQALAMLKSIASRGVFVKCLWYEGPVQIHEGDGAPSVPVIVKKIKGEDGKNLERIQHLTGVMIGVVLRRCGTGVSQEIDVVAQPRFIGLRIKCLRRKGLIEAIKEAEALLESVADHFSKELATHIATHIVELQSPTGHPSESVSNQSSPLASAMTTKDFLPHLLAKDENSLVSSKLNEVIKSDLVLGMESAPSVKEPDVHLSTEHEGNFRSLYASHLPDHMTTSKIQNIFEKLLREKLEPWTNLDHFPELVVDVRYIPDKSSAYIVLANEDLLDASLKLYAEDKSIFQGMRLELGPSEVNGSLAGSEPKKKKLGEHIRDAIAAKRESEKLSSREGAVDGDLDSDFSEDLWYADNLAPSTDVFPGRPRPLFLSELMRNASAPAIKQLFEEIITTYIGPNLVSASGRQLVLDVRYVPSRGCAFVDLATPELVEFMLDLHSRRPDVFLNMKMELGRRPVPYSVEEDGGGRLNLRLHGKPHSSSQMFDYWSPARKIIDKERNRSFDLEDPDRSDDLRWLNARMKKQRSDPEKTIYADRLPENSSEVTIQKVFERVLLQKLPREEMEALGDQIITEVRHVPTKYCAFIVFATEDLTRRVLHMYNQDEEVFESMRLKPHFHSRMEDFYKDELQEVDDVVHTPSVRERMGSLENDNARSRQLDIHDARSRSAAQRAITASAFREVDRRRSVYVDKIPEDLSESSMREIFEKVFRLKKHGRDGHMVSQVAYFRDKFDPSKLCAFVEVKTEDGTQDLVDYYNANQDAFRGMRVRPGFKYHH
ncbi:hypothetical protein KP509_09G018500 [Ceratopteris richardii]|nr:hypothetical protein KP509_09G018500 [Ceratopteris richardii]